MKTTITRKFEGLLDKVGSHFSQSFVSSAKENLIPTLQKSKKEIKETVVVVATLAIGGYTLYRIFSGSSTTLPPSAINVVVNIENLYMGGKV